MVGSIPYLGVGVYSVAEAERLTNIARRRIRRWLRGYTFEVDGEEHKSPPVWERQLPEIDGELSLGFLDLMEVRFVHAFLEEGVSWFLIRRAAAKAKDLMNKQHPFSTQTFKTDGRNIFLETITDAGEKDLLDLVKSQYAFEKIISPALLGVEFSIDGNASRWWPLESYRVGCARRARIFVTIQLVSMVLACL